MNKKKPTLLCDADIPYLPGWLAQNSHVITYQADKLAEAPLDRADGLIVRSVTRVTSALLKNSSCRFVGSVTAGINHVDVTALEEQGIHWNYAPGANAPAVCGYVLSALFLAKEKGRLPVNPCIGVIGVGEIGGRVAAACKQRGWDVVAYDPPREAREAAFFSASWDELLGCDVVIVCASYTQKGKWPSHHLVHEKALSQWQRLRVFINVARGEIVDYKALLETKRDELWTCLDVWPNEPNLNLHWVMRSDISTPHIAGYSRQSKWRLSYFIYEACCRFFNWPVEIVDSLGFIKKTAWCDEVGLERLSQKMKKAFLEKSSQDSFHTLRREYPLRDEVEFF